MVPRDLSSETQNMRRESIWPKQPNRAPNAQVPQKGGEVPSLQQKPSQFRLLRISLPSVPKKKKGRKHFSVFWTLALKLILPRNYWRPWWEWVVNWTFTFLPIMLFYCSDCGEEVGFVYQVELEVSGQGPGETKQPQDRTGTGHTGAIPEGCQSPFWL